MLQMLADRLAQYFHAYTLYSFVRPFGCSVLLSSYDDEGPHLYTIDPSGTCYVRMLDIGNMVLLAHIVPIAN